MTAVVDRPPAQHLWGSMPGWGIVADLTPPELIASRRLRVLRRVIGLCLLAILVLCAVSYVYAMRQTSSASTETAAAQARSTTLLAEAKKYSNVTGVEATVGGITGQLQTAMSTDVDVAAVLAKIRAGLPPTMDIDNLSLTITATAGAPGTPPTSGLDLTPHNVIGTVTLSGRAAGLNGLPAYLDALTRLPGVIDVLPTSNSQSGSTAQFTVTLSLTDELFSHHYTAAHLGGK